MDLSKQKVIFIGLVIGVIVIILSIVGFVQRDDSDTSTTTRTDKASGEQIKEATTSQQGTDTSLKNSIVYPGFSKLIDRGLSPLQIQSIQSTISAYSLQQEEPFTEVSLVTDSVRHILPQGESTTHMLTFELKANQVKDFYMTAEYKDTSSVITRLYAPDKTTLLIER
jgi:hypothetical protein